MRWRRSSARMNKSRRGMWDTAARAATKCLSIEPLFLCLGMGKSAILCSENTVGLVAYPETAQFIRVCSWL